jgi:NhaP-type Na+/H+ or K+/H+ antiporter
MNPHVRLGGKYARKHVPLNLRQILSAESAANDGLAFPFLTIALYLTLDSSWRIGIIHWILIGWLCAYVVFPLERRPYHVSLCLDQVILGTIIGAVLGMYLGVIYSIVLNLHSRSPVLAPDEILPQTGIH